LGTIRIPAAGWAVALVAVAALKRAAKLTLSIPIEAVLVFIFSLVALG